MFIIKERKWHLSWRCHDNSYASVAVLIETKIPRFCLKQGSSTPNNLLARVKTSLALKGCKCGYLVFQRKRLESRVLPWQQNSRCHSVSFCDVQFWCQVWRPLLQSRWSGDVMKRPGHKNFNAVSHSCSRPEVLFLNLTWRSRGQISSVLLQLLLFAFSNRKFGRHGKWSVTFWQWENNT